MVAAPRDFSRSSWRLKHARAEEHFKELEKHIGLYLNRDTHGVRRRHRGNPNPYVWTFALDVIEEPDDQTALILGDVVHNLRSALDHLANALTPCRSNRICFPIETANIWEVDASQNFVHRDDGARKRYLSNVEGMSYEALAILDQVQPYNVIPTGAYPKLRPHERVELHPLRVLSLFDNADKHRNLARLNFTMMGAISLMFVRGALVSYWPIPHTHHGADVAHQPFPPKDNPAESEVEVRVLGTKVVSVEIGLKDGMIPVLLNLRRLLDVIPSDIFDNLEPHVVAEE